MNDLIERLRSEADISDRPGQPDRLHALADEFAAALEAARRDAERYRFIAADHSAAWEEELDAAIDQARGKGVACVT